jgi:hypothetical protein
MRNVLFALLGLSLSVHAGGVFFSERSAGSSAIRAVDFGAASARKLGDAADPRGIVFIRSNERVYYLDRSSQRLCSFAGTGGDFQEHLTGIANAADLAADEELQLFYWCEERAGTGAIRRASFWASGDSFINSEVIFENLASPYYLDLGETGTSLCWSQNGSGLFSGAIGNSPQLLHDGGNANRGVAIDPNRQTVFRCQRGAGPLAGAGVFAFDLADGLERPVYGASSATGVALHTPHGLVLDCEAEMIYWTDTGTNSGSGFNPRGISRGDLEGRGQPEAVLIGDVTLQPWQLDLDLRTATYAEWRARFFRFDADAEVTAHLADPDRDGATNLEEYAFGSNPKNNHSLPAVVAGLPMLNSPGVLRFPRRRNAADIHYTIEISSDLSEWDEASVVEIEREAADAAGMEVVTVTPELLSEQGATAFFRLRVALK